MARRGGEAVAKRARERARMAKRQAKEEKRQARDNTDKLPANGEADLLEEFARLNADYQAQSISHDDFAVERDRILGELGIESN